MIKSLSLLIAFFSLCISFTTLADEPTYVQFDPFYMLQTRYGNPTATYHTVFESPTRPETGSAHFKTQELIRFKNKLVHTEVFTIEKERDRESMKSILGLKDDKKYDVNWFKFAYDVIPNPLPHVIQAALVAAQFAGEMPTGTSVSRGDLKNLVRIGGKLILTETVSTKGTWAYSRVLSYQIKVGEETVEVILGMSRMRAEIDP